MNYVNEFDAYPAQWTRNLAAAGVIAPCVVDERSILDVCPADLETYAQCHFFGGIGVWPAAFRIAGIPDDFPVWSGSCPCQGFSVAGQGKGFADERHLWPAWFHLIEQRRPVLIFGEQVDSPLARAWLDLVYADLEGIGYAVGACVAPAAGFGAPHGRHRIMFVAHALRPGWAKRWAGAGAGPFAGRGGSGKLADAGGGELRGRHEYRSDARAPGEIRSETWEQRIWPDGRSDGATGKLADDDDDARLEGRLGMRERRNERAAGPSSVGYVGALDHAASGHSGNGELQRSGQHGLQPEVRGGSEFLEHPESEQARVSRCARERRATGGFWADADWIPCRGGKWRAVEPGTFPLVNGAVNRMGKLRAYGNAIVLPQAVEFVKASLAALMEVTP